MRDPYTLKPKLFCWTASLVTALGAYLILMVCGYAPLLWPFVRDAWALLAGIGGIGLGMFLFRNGDPRKAYSQPARFLGRPDAPTGERRELADFFRKNKGQAMSGLLIGEKWIIYSSFTQTFVYPRSSLRRVIKEITVVPDVESGRNEKRLVLHFDGSELYAGKRGHYIRSTEHQIDRWIVYIRECCSDLSVEDFTLLYNTSNYQ